MTSRVIIGDCREVLATLDAGSVQCCVTSPPYFNLRDYGTATWEGGDPGCDHSRQSAVSRASSGLDGATDTQGGAVAYRDICGKCGARRTDAQIGLEQSPDAYVAEMVAVFREVRRVLRDDGTVWLNIGDSYSTGSGGDRRMGDPSNPKAGGAASWRSEARAQVGTKPKDLLMIPARVALALQADGWWLRSDIIWAKPNPMPESVTSRPTSAHEHVFLLSKRASYYWDAEAVAEPIAEATANDKRIGTERPADYEATDANLGHLPGSRRSARNAVGGGSSRNLRNVWTIATQPYSGAHFATMPAELAERCIKAGTSERGQCPHCAAPWARVMERLAGVAGEAAERPKQTAGMASKTSTLSMSGNGSKVWQERGPKSETTGWQPTCACPEHAPVPQTVLDPFAGAGTTLLCADRLGRNGIGIELNPAYAVMARNRLTDDCPLFADVAD